MRLDKYLANMGIGSRKEVKQLIKQKRVRVNEKIITADKFQVDEKKDKIIFAGEAISYQKFFYYMLNKPAGIITATRDNFAKTVLDLLSNEDYRQDLFPVGRLDKDTEGLLLITNDGALSHHLLSPRHHIEKEYFAETAGIMRDHDIARFAQGLEIDQGEICLPAKVVIEAINEDKETSQIRLILQEGKFHQVKRMVHAVGKEVTYLKRIRMGGLYLDDQLSLGNYRELTEEELRWLG